MTTIMTVYSLNDSIPTENYIRRSERDAQHRLLTLGLLTCARAALAAEVPGDQNELSARLRYTIAVYNDRAGSYKQMRALERRTGKFYVIPFTIDIGDRALALEDCCLTTGFAVAAFSQH